MNKIDDTLIRRLVHRSNDRVYDSTDKSLVIVKLTLSSMLFDFNCTKSAGMHVVHYVIVDTHTHRTTILWVNNIPILISSSRLLSSNKAKFLQSLT